MSIATTRAKADRHRGSHDPCNTTAIADLHQYIPEWEESMHSPWLGVWRDGKPWFTMAGHSAKSWLCDRYGITVGWRSSRRAWSYGRREERVRVWWPELSCGGARTGGFSSAFAAR